MRTAWAVAAVAFFALATSLSSARAQEFRIKEVPSLTALAPAQLEPRTIFFSDHRAEEAADPVTGLIRFEDWAKVNPSQKEFLSLYPGYAEPVINVTVHGVTKPYKKKLHVYVAEARFVLPKPANAVNPARYASLQAIDKVDPSIKHRRIAAADAIPLKDPESAYNRNPVRRWCEGTPQTVCIESHYQLEGKLPLGIRLANKLEDGGKKIAEFMEFQSELRPLSGPEATEAGFGKLTRLDAPITGALEQNIFAVNQVLTFGRFIAVFQQHPSDANRTIVTAVMALGIKSDVLDKRKEFERVPVLRNLVPGQVLTGNSSFNTGSSISAGLPKYVRNRLQAIAGMLERD